MLHLDNFTTPFSFVLPTKIIYAPGAAASLGAELLKLGVKKPLIVTDSGIIKAGIIAKIEAELPSEIRCTVFSEVEPNPKDYNVSAGADLYRSVAADGILAIGGGSPIDCAKAIGVLIAEDSDDIKAFAGRDVAKNPLPPLIAVPTTAGTGSELTFSSVITDSSQNFKFTVKNAYTAPLVAICDPVLTLSVPPAITAATGMDALTHAIEAYTATCAEPISDALALYAIEIISESLRTAYSEPHDLEARSKMLMGSMQAGIAFSHADVASVHCIAEALGGIYDLPHGVCNAVILPFMMEYNMEYCQDRYARVAKAMGVSHEPGITGALAAVEAVRQLAKDVNLPKFSEFNIANNDLPTLARASYINGSTPSNPRPMGEEDYLKVLKIMAKE